MSWTKKNVHPGKIVSTSQEVDVKVLEVDEEKRRISLGLKQAQANPWEAFAEAHPVGSTVEGEVKNSTEFGLFIGLEGDVDGMVHMSDIAWGVSGEEALQLHRKGETRQGAGARRRRREGAHQPRHEAARARRRFAGAARPAAPRRARPSPSPFSRSRTAGSRSRSATMAPIGFIKRTDLGRDRDEQRPERFQVGQKFDAQVTGFDRSKKPNFSIKALQISEEKQAVAQYGSSDSGASLGDILGAALKEKQAAAGGKAAAEPKAEKPAKRPRQAENRAKAEKPRSPSPRRRSQGRGQGRRSCGGRRDGRGRRGPVAEAPEAETAQADKNKPLPERAEEGRGGLRIPAPFSVPKCRISERGRNVWPEPHIGHAPGMTCMGGFSFS